MSGPTESGDHTRLATSFDATAGAYELGRPEYPDIALDWWDERGAFETGAVVLDLAAGTGKLTRLLPVLCELHAVEPLAHMREQFAAAVPDLTVIDGTAERIPFPDDTFDTVLIAQAFHWFDQPAALTEIARVLKPGGGLGLIWNYDEPSHPDGEPSDWVHAIIDQKRSVAPSPTDGSDPTFDVLRAHHCYESPEWSEHHWRFETTVERVLADVLSRSYVGSLEPAERLAVLTRVREAIEHLGDTIAYPYRTSVFWVRSLP